MNATAPEAPSAGPRAVMPPASTLIEITSPESAADWDAARSLIEDLFGFIERESGLPPAQVYDGLDEELRALPQHYSYPKGAFFVAKVDGNVAGTTGVKLLEPGMAEIKRVYVRPETRGLRLGSALLDAAINVSRILGAERIRLESHSGFMRTAVAMYGSRGFVEIPHYTGLGDRVPGAVAMELRL